MAASHRTHGRLSPVPAARPYHFRNRWSVEQEREDLWDALEELLASDDPMPWWRSVRVVDHRGDELDLVASSVLGYRLAFTVHDLQLVRPTSIRLRSRGDLEGHAVLTFTPAGNAATHVDIEWNVAATRRWMQRLDPVLRPAFVLAHGVIMRTGQRRLNRWLAVRGPRRPR